MTPDISWACSDISNIKSEFNLEKYIILFPFSSSHLTVKRWPYFNELINKIKSKFKESYKIIVAPGPDEINDAKNINATCILDRGNALDLTKLSSLIKDSSFVISNDTGPAHMTAHLGAKGIALFGPHTTPYKVSIERKNFKAIQVSDLAKLSTEKVFEHLLRSLS